MNQNGFLKPKIKTGFDFNTVVLFQLTLWIQLYSIPVMGNFDRLMWSTHQALGGIGSTNMSPETVEAHTGRLRLCLVIIQWQPL